MENDKREIDKKDIEKINIFATDIIKKLRNEKNSEKKHWREEDLEDLFYKLFYEILELKEALLTGEKKLDDIQDECKDVAAFAFFIYDNVEQAVK